MQQRYWTLILAVVVLSCAGSALAAEPDDADLYGEAIAVEPSSEVIGSPSSQDAGQFLRLFGCYQPRRPVWYFQADALALRRDASDRVFAEWGQSTWITVENPNYKDPPTGEEIDDRITVQRALHLWEGTYSFTTALSLNDTNINRFQGGGRLLLGRTLGRDSAMEIAYFDLADWSGTAVIQNDTAFIATANPYDDEDSSGILLHFLKT